MTLPGYFWDRWPYFAGKLSWDITTTQVNSALHPSGIAKSSTSFGWGKGGKVTSAGWQVTLCDLIRHVISRSGVVISITNCYIRLPLLYFTMRMRTDSSARLHSGSLVEIRGRTRTQNFRIRTSPFTSHRLLMQTGDASYHGEWATFFQPARRAKQHRRNARAETAPATRD